MREPLQEIDGEPCENPIEGAELVADLDWYDGTITVAIMRTGDGLWFRVWGAIDRCRERWLMAKTTRERVDALGDGRIMLAEILREPADGRLIVLVIGDDGNVLQCVVANDREALAKEHLGDVPFPREEWRTQPAWQD
jgi:hypothetical protein